MTVGIVEASRNAQVDDIRNRFDAGSGPGILEFYTAPRPATGAAVGGATLLGVGTLSAVSLPDAVGGTATANAITGDGSNDGTGDAAWVRGKDSDGNFVCDLSAGLASDVPVPEVVMGSISIEAGGTLEIDSLVLTAGNP